MVTEQDVEKLGTSGTWGVNLALLILILMYHSNSHQSQNVHDKLFYPGSCAFPGGFKLALVTPLL